MTDFFVDSAGSNTAPYDTWAKAATKLINSLTTGAGSGVAQAGDTIYVASTHSESTSGNIAYSTNGTAASPVNVLTVIVNGASGNSGLASGAAVVTATAGNLLSFANGFAYIYGINFTAVADLSGGGGGVISCTSSIKSFWLFERCSWKQGSSSGMGQLGGSVTGSTERSHVKFIDCALNTAFANQSWQFTNEFTWENTDANMITVFGDTNAIRGTASTTLFILSLGGLSKARLRGVDLSAVSGTLVAASTTQDLDAIFDGCKINSGVTVLGSPTNGDMAGPRVALFNCDSADTNYRLQIEDGLGTTKQETTIVRTTPAGASDGTTPASWKMTSRASVPHFVFPMKSPDITIWNDTEGSAKTITVQIVNDGVTLTDAEAWLEIEYFSSATLPTRSFASDRAADILATAANQTTSSDTWTTTGLTTPVKQALAVTVTPQQKGEIIARVRLAKASQTIYVNPMAEIT